MSRSPSEVKVGDLVVTAGARATEQRLADPAEHPDRHGHAPRPPTRRGTITVAPAADLTSLETVQVLTRVTGS